VKASPALTGIVVAVVSVAAAAGVLHARETRYPAPGEAQQLLYLRSGGVAKRLALTFDGLVSDVYWIRAIQHFGRDAHRLNLRSNWGTPAGTFDRRRDFVLLHPLLDLTTTLDPRFNIAYRFGAVFLAAQPPFGPGRADQALALLEKGLARNPTRWQYAFDKGFIHFWAGRDAEAAALEFERAAAIPGAPNWLRPLIASTRMQTGDRAAARTMLQQMRDSEAEYIRRAADRGLAQLEAMDLIDRVNVVIEAYARMQQTYPGGWADLQAARLIGAVPTDPAGVPLVYDAVAHVAVLSPQSPLAPLPRPMPPPRRGPE
jgi:hypothetical protein